MTDILFSTQGAVLVSFILGILLDNFFRSKKERKIIKAVVHAFATVLENYDIPYDDFLLEVIHRLKLLENDTKKSEEEILKEIDELRTKAEKWNEPELYIKKERDFEQKLKDAEENMSQ